MTALGGISRTLDLACGKRTVTARTRSLIAIEKKYGSWAGMGEALRAHPAETTTYLLASVEQVTEEDAADLLDGSVIADVAKTLDDMIGEALWGPPEPDRAETNGTEAADPSTPGSLTPGATS